MKLFGGTGHNTRKRPAARGGEAKPPKSGKGKKTLLIILAVLVILVGGVFAYWKLTTRPPDVVSPTPDSEQTGQNGDNIEIIDTETREIGHYYTVLVVGEDQLRMNTDTIMVARFDAVEKKVDVVSIPRDTVVYYDGGYRRINSVYYRAENGGIEGLMDAVEDVTGFRPDNYVVVQTDVFVKAIDALGGVWFDVPVDMNYDDYSDNDNDGVVDYLFQIHIDKGYQWLSGENAMKVFRFRQNNDGTGYPGGDWDRLEVQHNLIKALADEALKLNNLNKLYEIARIVSDSSETDLLYSNIQWYAQQFLMMDTSNINVSTMPTTGLWVRTNSSANEMALVTINIDEWLTIVNNQLNPYKNEITRDDCSIVYLNAPKQLINGQLHAPTSELAVTGGGQ